MTATLAALPDADSGDNITDDEFDHIEEAKAQLDEVVTTGRLDFSTAVAVAQTHALISIAQSLEALAFQSALSDLPVGLSVVNIDTADDEPTAPVPPAKPFTSVPDYYREG
jgi:hypothetical protein